MKVKSEKEIVEDLISFEKQGKHHLVKLPCGHASVEITKPEDQYVTCPNCLHKWLLMWSQIEEGRRIKEVS